MTDLTVFQYADQSVRTVTIDGDPWFVLADLARVLEIKDVSRLASRLDDGVRQAHPITDSMGRTQNATIVNESGMYEVVIRSDKPEAVAFRRWITSDVLPQIRKTGQYNGATQLPKSLGEALALAAQIELERERLELQTAIDAPKVEAFDTFIDATGSYAMEAVAKSLADVTGGMGRNKLFEYLREHKVLMSNNSPYQAYAHWFEIKTRTFRDSKGVDHATRTTYVRPEGLDSIRRLFVRKQVAA